MQIKDYPRVQNVIPDNVFIIDGPNGTKSILASNLGFINVPFEILTGAWQTSTTYTGYAYQASLSIPGHTSADLVRADFDLGSLIVASDVGLAPAGNSTNGAVIFYAKKIPGSNLTGMYTTFKGVV